VRAGGRRGGGGTGGGGGWLTRASGGGQGRDPMRAPGRTQRWGLRPPCH
jgi:hypothetical protein